MATRELSHPSCVCYHSWWILDTYQRRSLRRPRVVHGFFPMTAPGFREREGGVAQGDVGLAPVLAAEEQSIC